MGHTGSLSGYVSRTALVPELKLGIVILTNQEVTAAHAAAMGAESRHVTSIVELRQALSDTRELTRTVVLVIEVDAHAWSEGGSFWEVGYPRSSSRPEVQEAAARMSQAVLQRDERRRV